MNFKEYLQQKNIINKTITRHQSEVTKYNAWLKTIDLIDIQATTKDLLNYLQHIKQTRNLCSATQNKILQRLKNYYQYLAKTQGIKDISCFIKIRGTQKTQLHQCLTNTDIELLCDAYYFFIQSYKPTIKKIYFNPNYQNLLLGYYVSLTLVAQQALTINEVLLLKKENFDLRKGTIHIQQHLRGNARTLTLDGSQIGSIIEFYSNEPQGLLMLNKNHFNKLDKTLKTLTPKYKHFRQLRASKITEWLNTQGLRKAQVLAGHRSINATEKYIPNNIDSLQNDMANYHPLQ
jgi:integrase